MAVQRSIRVLLVCAAALAFATAPRAVALGHGPNGPPTRSNASAAPATENGAAMPTGGPSASGEDAARLVRILTERGVPQDKAQAVVDSLTPDDIRVLAQNPEMIQAAGDEASAVALTLIVVLLVVLIIVIAV